MFCMAIYGDIYHVQAVSYAVIKMNGNVQVATANSIFLIMYNLPYAI